MPHVLRFGIPDTQISKRAIELSGEPLLIEPKEHETEASDDVARPIICTVKLLKSPNA